MDSKLTLNLFDLDVIEVRVSHFSEIIVKKIVRHR